MSKKFTEEQYKKLVLLQKEYFSNNVLYPDQDFKSLVGTIRIDEKRLYNFIVSCGLENQTVAIMNPLTREWAHEQFVEKEKKYYWSTKKKNEQGKPLKLFHGAGGVVQMIGPEQALTEAEIREWGFSPEMFDREEV